MISLFRKPRIYLDYASITPIDKDVVAVMNKYSSHKYANPSSWYKEGVLAKEAIGSARTNIADFFRAHKDEIIFTSGGTEANNIAILGVVGSALASGKKYSDLHIIVSAIEHSSILEVVRHLKEKGVMVDYIPVNHDGQVILEDLKRLLRPDTTIVSIMTVNNETGCFQPIRSIAKIIRKIKTENSRYPIFHTDASQAVQYFDLNVEKMSVDLMTIDGSKMYGPRGSGLLFIRRNTPIRSIIFGGGQEFGMRSGTENLPNIMGLNEAFNILINERRESSPDLEEISKEFGFELNLVGKEIIRIMDLKHDLIHGLMKINPTIKINGINCSPHILNISIPNIDNEFFIFQLDANGIACSTKSSCLRDEDESYVLKSMNISSKSSVRFSFGRDLRKKDIDRVIEVARPTLAG